MTQEDLLRKILNDDVEQFSIQEIFEIFVIIFNGFEKNSRTVESIKSKITKRKNDNHIRSPFFKKIFIMFWTGLSDKK